MNNGIYDIQDFVMNAGDADVVAFGGLPLQSCYMGLSRVGYLKRLTDGK